MVGMRNCVSIIKIFIWPILFWEGNLWVHGENIRKLSKAKFPIFRRSLAPQTGPCQPACLDIAVCIRNTCTCPTPLVYSINGCNLPSQPLVPPPPPPPSPIELPTPPPYTQPPPPPPSPPPSPSQPFMSPPGCVPAPVPAVPQTQPSYYYSPSGLGQPRPYLNPPRPVSVPQIPVQQAPCAQPLYAAPVQQMIPVPVGHPMPASACNPPCAGTALCVRGACTCPIPIPYSPHIGCVKALPSPALGPIPVQAAPVYLQPSYQPVYRQPCSIGTCLADTVPSPAYQPPPPPPPQSSPPQCTPPCIGSAVCLQDSCQCTNRVQYSKYFGCESIKSVVKGILRSWSNLLE